MGCGIDVPFDDRISIVSVIRLAWDDQTNYLRDGAPNADYGSDWPVAAREKARDWRKVAAFVRRLGSEVLANDADELAIKLDNEAVNAERKVSR